MKPKPPLPTPEDRYKMEELRLKETTERERIVENLLKWLKAIVLGWQVVWLLARFGIEIDPQVLVEIITGVGG